MTRRRINPDRVRTGAEMVLELRRKRKVLGLCTYCGLYPMPKQSAIYAMCPQCTRTATERKARWQQKTGYSRADWRAAKRAEWVKAGLCTRCGKKPSRPGRKTCGYC